MNMRLIVILLTLISSVSAYCQYPKKLVLGGDTVIALSLDQVKVINLGMSELSATKEMNSIVLTELDTYRVKDSLRVKEADDLKLKIKYMESNIEMYKSNIDNIKSMYEDRKRKYLVIGGLGVVIGVGGLITALVK